MLLDGLMLIALIACFALMGALVRFCANVVDRP